MRSCYCFIVLLLLAGGAYAFEIDSGAPAPVKAGTVPPLPSVNPRQGGDTIADAVPISVPTTEIGTTAGYHHDYDEVCPFDHPGAPDVVYSYTPLEDYDIEIDLCYSGYDTKVYVYQDGVGNLVACNDDAYYGPPCFTYSSKLEHVIVTEGHTYYIVIDGYSPTDFGDYQMDVTPYVECTLECPPGGVPEGEPEITEDYVDNYNSGCAGYPELPFQVLEAVDEPDCITLCSVSGHYTYMGMSYRDTDWFEVTAVGNFIECTIASEWPVYLLHLAPTDCASVGVAQSVLVHDCPDPEYMTIETTPGTVYWLWVGPDTFSGYPMNYNYILEVCGIYGTVPVEQETWGGLKNRYR